MSASPDAPAGGQLPRRSLRADARDNRERILRHAREVFAADGLRVPVREVARRADVGVATVYRHFPTKRVLIQAAFSEQVPACSAVVAAGLEEADPWSALAGVVTVLMEVHTRDRGLARVSSASSSRAATDGLASERQRSLTGLGQLLDRAQAAGAVRADVHLQDVVLALMANEGVHAADEAARVAASARLAALVLRSFRT